MRITLIQTALVNIIQDLSRITYDHDIVKNAKTINLIILKKDKLIHKFSQCIYTVIDWRLEVKSTYLHSLI
jgi:hypothetical protein